MHIYRLGCVYDLDTLLGLNPLDGCANPVRISYEKAVQVRVLGYGLGHSRSGSCEPVVAAHHVDGQINLQAGSTMR